MTLSHRRLLASVLLFLAGLSACGDESGWDIYLEELASVSCERAERVGDALGKVADLALVDQLLAMTRHTDATERYKAVRVLGKLADRDDAGPLLRDYAAEPVTTALLQRLEIETDPIVLSTAIWVLDEFFLPFLPMEARVRAIGEDAATWSEDVRWWALWAAGRLISTKEALSESDYGYVLAQLQSLDPLVQQQGADTCRWIATKTDRSEAIVAALRSALNAASPAARYFIAMALREYGAPDNEAEAALALALQQQLPALHSVDLSTHAVVVRAANEPDARRFAELLTVTTNTFHAIGGEFFDLPVASSPSLTANVFPTRDAYTAFARNLAPLLAGRVGFFNHDQDALYTYDGRGPDSVESTEATLQHEYTHFLQRKFILPRPTVYSAVLPFWVSEGLAEYVGGLLGGNAEQFVPLSGSLDRICNLPRRELSALLVEHPPYFPTLPACGNSVVNTAYADAWWFVAYLFQAEPQTAQRILAAYKFDGLLDLSAISVAAIKPIDELEWAWHATIDSWCNQ